MGGAMDDLTAQGKATPQGQRIIVSGRVLDENGRPVPNTVMEIWQANKTLGNIQWVRGRRP